MCFKQKRRGFAGGFGKKKSDAIGAPLLITDYNYRTFSSFLASSREKETGFLS